ncbi:MAG: dephospho-CoA kinase [Victivallales bacterium]|nr:dephospho-CoA kinase [Victivallales bacterium]
MPLIVITGGIGAGKSTVMKYFAECGCSCGDADDFVHQLYVPGGEMCRRLAERFGDEVLNSDGSLNRKAVADLVFGNEAELEWLNSQIHPLVRGRIEAEAAAAADKLYFAAVPLWFECGWEGGGDVPVVAVWCDGATQRQRLLKRGWSDDEIRARLARQLSMDEKLKRADYGIMTACSWEETRRQCDILLQRLKHPANC